VGAEQLSKPVNMSVVSKSNLSTSCDWQLKRGSEPQTHIYTARNTHRYAQTLSHRPEIRSINKMVTHEPKCPADLSEVKTTNSENSRETPSPLSPKSLNLIAVAIMQKLAQSKRTQLIFNNAQIDSSQLLLPFWKLKLL